jgi:hypothetical protein
MEMIHWLEPESRRAKLEEPTGTGAGEAEEMTSEDKVTAFW